MTALALPRRRQFWLPKFEPWRLLKPLKMDGQWFPRQSIQFSDGVMPSNIGVGGVVSPANVVDEGSANPSSGTGTSSHTFNSISAAGPVSAILLSWTDGSAKTISSITWDGSAMTLWGQVNYTTASPYLGAAIAYYDGSRSGNVVVTFSGSTDDSRITAISLENLQSLTANDVVTDANGGTSTVAVNNIDVPADGVSIVAGSHSYDTFAAGYDPNRVFYGIDNILDDTDAGSFRHCSGWEVDAGNNSTTIKYGGSPPGSGVGAGIAVGIR